MNTYHDSPDMTIDPLKFLELEKSEILFKLTIEIGYSEEKAILKFDFMTDIINRLKPLRAYKSQTIDFLEKIIKHISYKAKSFILNFLIKAVIAIDTYCHSYNTLASFANRDVVIPYPVKYIPENKLLAMLEEEKTKLTLSADTPNNPPGNALKTFKTSLSPVELNTVRQRLIKDQRINKISEADFIYLFTQQALSPEMIKLTWNDSLCLCHEFLSRIVFSDSNFNYKQSNSCINFKESKKLSSSYKSKAQYKNDDFFNLLLSF